MGRDKAKLRLDGRTLLGQVRVTVKGIGFPARVIRRDLIPPCGPMGGIYTGLKTSQSDSILFVSCDMPFVSPQFLSKIIRSLGSGMDGVFSNHDAGVGFPFLLRVLVLPEVERLIAKRQFSIQALAEKLRIKRVAPPRRDCLCLLNINTPEEWKRARQLWKKHRQRSRGVATRIAENR
jgi:molybdenum cofactor guanylyltransferase